MAEALRFDGSILGASFAGGHTLVFGRWYRSPFGGFADLMLRRPDGRRIFIAPRGDVARFVDRHYRFDEVRHARVRVERDPADAHRIIALADDVSLELDLGPRGAIGWLLRTRPRPLRELDAWNAIEDAVFRPIVAPLLGGGAGIHARGTTRAGARQRYVIHDLRPARARARIGGVDLGPAVVPDWSADFGASEFPGEPAVVSVSSFIEDALED